MDEREAALAELLTEDVVPDRASRMSIVVAWLVAVAFIIGAGTVWWSLRGEEAPAPSTAVPGADGSPEVGSTTVSVPATGAPAATTTTIIAYPGERVFASMASRPDGMLLYGGRDTGHGDSFIATWLLKTLDEWVPVTATLEPAHREHAALTYVDSLERFAVLGGRTDSASCSQFGQHPSTEVDVWFVDPEQAAWEQADFGSAPSPRWGYSAAYHAGTDAIFIFGGFGTERTINKVELFAETWQFDVASGSWSEVSSDVVPPERGCMGLAADPGAGVLYLWGGLTEAAAGDPTLWSFEPGSGEWSAVDVVGEVPAARWSHQLVFEPITGSLYALGGQWYASTENDSGTTTELTASAEVWAFDPGTRTWEAREPMPEPSIGHAAAADGSGRLFVFAGSQLWVYDTAQDSWTDVTPYELIAED